ncbi:carboxylesterase/lipase family protein [Achromobacter spanius]|uniref:Carboxylesterase/lipase family protein n=1 Tax=Achromobacter spanius TaxID=217203 RepID=A0A2S5GPQ6_9BURK|nr:carboxylesterase family protein [Achromobacter spanius]PPA75082.1 carboxylesterase/lipase family protein [Achromobacter spanius]
MNQTVQATLPAGTLTGVQERGGVCRFSAIPYARPPVGKLRFAPPEAATWQGDLDATQPGPVAPQLPSRLRDAMGDFNAPQSEDCLHLTVWTPAADGARRPVVVWLHGGAWQSGGGALDWYDGSALAARGDLVVVAVNYRLAALGWLYVPGQTANVGLLDQEAAIDWVFDNITGLGGDPERVTVMGQSAGASSICAMLARKPRFSRAILQSAALGRGFRSAAQAQALGQAFLEAAGVASLDAARALPVSALLAAQQSPAVAEVLRAEGSSRSQFCPVLDGHVLPEDIAPALQRAASRADVLVAYTRNEMAAFPGYVANATKAEGLATTDNHARAHVDPNHVGNVSPGHVDPSRVDHVKPGHVDHVGPALDDPIGDQVFGAPSRAWARAAVTQGRQAWLARFDVAPTARFKACHCIELPFVFDTVSAFGDAPMLAGLDAAHAQRLTAQTQQAWLAFIRGDAPDWPMAPHLHVFA